MMIYKKQLSDGDLAVKVIDKQNNYSIATRSDPEPTGYVDHQWGNDIADWQEISQAEAEAILGCSIE